MNETTTNDPTEILHALRGISHDMGAAHMMLEHSFRRLKTLLETRPSEASPADEMELHLSQVEACMQAARGYLDDVTRLSTSGAVEMEPEPVEVAAMLDRILLEQAALLDERGVEVRVCGQLPAVWCHPERLKQMLTNLLRNAVLHGCAPERPRVVVRACDPPEGDDSLAAVRIHDNGPGIDRRRRREIFLPGRRLKGGKAEGSGWGLPTARRIAERFGGSLVLDTDCRHGTAFILTLPDASEALSHSEPVEEGRRWRLQLDARHRSPLRHGHSRLANDECRTASAD